MKRLIIILIIILIPNLSFANTESNNCEGLNKLKPSCNFVGLGMDKLKNFSKKNQTIDQSIKNVQDSKTLKKVKEKINKK